MLSFAIGANMIPIIQPFMRLPTLPSVSQVDPENLKSQVPKGVAIG